MAEDGRHSELLRQGIGDAEGGARRRKVLLQTTAYCGTPAALESFRITAEVLKEEHEKKR